MWIGLGGLLAALVVVAAVVVAVMRVKSQRRRQQKHRGDDVVVPTAVVTAAYIGTATTAQTSAVPTKPTATGAYLSEKHSVLDENTTNVAHEPTTVSYTHLTLPTRKNV